MGGGRWTTSDWSKYKSSRSITEDSSVRDIYKSRSLNPSLNPYGVKVRESRDSAEHPNSTPIILAFDVTGSMGYLAEEIAKNSINSLILDLYKENNVKDPQVMIMAIGDAYSDRAPLQVSQFESDIRIAEQLSDVYFEGCGGGNGGESYSAAWYFASRHTDIDSYNLHNRKGFLFTIGDEPVHKYLTKEQIFTIFGDKVPEDLSVEELRDEVSKKYHIFHICVGHAELYDSLPKWSRIMGERTMYLKDHTKLASKIKELIMLQSSQDEFMVKEFHDKDNLEKADGADLVTF